MNAPPCLAKQSFSFAYLAVVTASSFQESPPPSPIPDPFSLLPPIVHVKMPAVRQTLLQGHERTQAVSRGSILSRSLWLQMLGLRIRPGFISGLSPWRGELPEPVRRPQPKGAGKRLEHDRRPHVSVPCRCVDPVP